MEMNSVVIGAGFGGIAASLRLKSKGHNVTLIEKHPDLGGRARVFKKNGFIYDGGPTVITAPYLINELFELFKKNPKDYIDLAPLKIWYQFIFEDKTKFNYSGDEDEMKRQIEKLNKDDVEGYEELVSFYPKKRYWVQLSGIYGEFKEESKQLGALEAAHDQRLLDKENEYVVLYQLLMRAEAPFKAAKVIDYGIEEEFVEENEKHLKYLAQAWHLSQELDKAEPVYKKAAEKAKDGELYVFLGQIYLATDRYDMASESLKKGLEKGKLKDPVSVNILLGQVAYEQQKFDEATTFFRKSLDKVSDIKGKNEEDTYKKQDKLRNQALKWLTYTENERERVRILNLRRKDLEENA